MNSSPSPNHDIHFSLDFLTDLKEEYKFTEGEIEVIKCFSGAVLENNDTPENKEISNHLLITDSTVSTRLTGVYKKFNISNSGPVKKTILRDTLRDRYQSWSKQKSQPGTNKNYQNNQQPNDLQAEDNIFKPIQERCKQTINKQHSTIRLFNKDTIKVEHLYVDVLLLNKPSQTKEVLPSERGKYINIVDGISKQSNPDERCSGFDVAKKYNKLLISGKPGSGKTTFLKHLAQCWSNGIFQSDSIAVVIEFRNIQGEEWSLIHAIEKELELEGNWNKIQELKAQKKKIKDELSKSVSEYSNDKKNLKNEQSLKKLQELEHELKSLPLESLLQQGKLLLLMDGLDEVPTDKLRRSVQRQISDLAQEYENNHFILTCRIQIDLETVLTSDFTWVQVADFNTEQVEHFVKNWFTMQTDDKAEQKWQIFNKIFFQDKALNELAFTPVLLNLICLILENSSSLDNKLALESKDINHIYRRGIYLLLTELNEVKNIIGWERGTEKYRQLSNKEKELLLIHLAAHKFVNPDNFITFEEDEIINQIIDFFKKDKKIQLTNNEAKGVLKAMEAQHGLLIERAKQWWTFSHLTLQEYFTIEWLTTLTSKELAEKVANNVWQNAVQRLVKSQKPADRFVRLIKQAIDNSIKVDENDMDELEDNTNLQKYLTWVFKQSQVIQEAIQADYKPIAIRAFYFTLPMFNLTHAIEFSISCDLSRNFNCDFDFEKEFDGLIDINKSFDRARKRIKDCRKGLKRFQSFACFLDPELGNRLAQITELLPNLSVKDPDLQRWVRSSDIQQLKNEVDQVINQHLNICPNCQFSDEQKQKLQRYYDANKFLLDLINIQGTVSDAFRIEIENSLLLPWEELQNRS
ncbi:putative signal transduction protein with Nacht domain [Calothrix sp. NIES-2100]|uniref:NACHT C-terminal helical domain 2-containing protein n=1 Tax=Calothrix sp. NIES-2100 TaxID=1954172 RepID=UPI000B5F1ADA|nr:putative signal transduction protein with Nacht domain [Calothrix sp. NIES-2100]